MPTPKAKKLAELQQKKEEATTKLFVEEYQALCLKHKRIIKPVLVPSTQMLKADLQIYKVEEKPKEEASVLETK